MKKEIKEQNEALQTTHEMRANLKNIIAIEIKLLPDYLAKLTPEKRLETVLKLMPYVFPRVESVSMSSGEPSKWDL